MNEPKFVKRKKPNNKRLILLLVVLLAIIGIYIYLDEIMAMFS